MDITLRQIVSMVFPLRPRVVAPLLGALFLILWEIAESGRAGIGPRSIVFLLFAITIAVSMWQPIASLALMILIPALQLLGILPPPTSTDWPVYFASAFAVFFVALYAGKTMRYLALPVGAVAAALSAWRMVAPSAQGSYVWWTGQHSWLWPVGDTLHLYPFKAAVPMLALAGLCVYLIFWVAGFIAATFGLDRTLDATRSRLRQTDFELRIEQDRARISRELHDAAAHSLAVMVSQAEGALAQRDKAITERTLRNIAAVGREALTDVRGLIERIQSDDVLEARPTASDIETLVERMREIGMAASLEAHGEPGPLTPARQTAVYRIVQESLTNALKHGGADATVTVTLDWRGPGLAVLVASTGTEPLVPPGSEQADSCGVGIEGMRERARLVGGWLTAEPAGDGVFLVTAFVPTHPATETGADAASGAAALEAVR